MEGGKDEALQVKFLAELKFTEKDYVGAKKLALKAQNLFPSLEEISQMITILDVYLASETKVNGEKDWYAVLHVDSSADEETVKNHYRKLALMLHPDRNRSAGAEGAFQLVSQAWSVLSDKNQKMLYDQRTFHPSKDSSTPGFENNGFYQFSGNASAKARIQHSNSNRPPYRPQAETFWTSCDRCCMQYEFHSLYLNKSLLCPKCKQPFLATELPAPPTRLCNPHQWSSKQKKKSVKSKRPHRNLSPPTGMAVSGLHHGLNTQSFTNQNIQYPPFSGVGANGLSTGMTQSPNAAHQTYKAKRQREDTHTTVRREEALRRKLLRRTFIGNQLVGVFADKSTTKIGDVSGNHIAPDQRASNVGCNRNTISERDYSKSKLSPRSMIFSRAYTHADVRAILIEKAKNGILKKLSELYSAEATKTKNNDMMVKKQKCKEAKGTNLVDRKNLKYNVHGESDDMQIHDFSRSYNKEVHDKKLCHYDGSDDSKKQVNHHLSIDVPDPDFHDFDSDRTEIAFRADQVWATYDDDDGMPRYYAFIQKVLSVKPFKARISFLTSKSNAEFGALDWISSGFPKTCGDFRVGRHLVANKINIFSHHVKWEKGYRGVVRVLPRKGDIWALYRNWHASWSELTPDDVIHKYEMVEVLEDYSKDRGISVAPLVKVAGFKTVFLKHMDPNENRRIPKEEMFRFSHQVPSYLLTGEEAQNAPKGCLELDPAATSLDLLQVLTETKDEDVMDDAEREFVVDHGVPCPISDLVPVIQPQFRTTKRALRDSDFWTEMMILDGAPSEFGTSADPSLVGLKKASECDQKAD
ncbi:Chaperone protein dnaJ 10 [Platanthera guangdongensis]|uniref:Chaperone protein dnaJ 10 n=1 Tax=Platanthera guangdongensis TaxID=2320717 RepID=A0ABR2M9G3_9ASPA